MGGCRIPPAPGPPRALLGLLSPRHVSPGAARAALFSGPVSRLCFPAPVQEREPTGKEITQGMFYRQEPSAEAKSWRMENTFGATMGAW